MIDGVARLPVGCGSDQSATQTQVADDVGGRSGMIEGVQMQTEGTGVQQRGGQVRYRTDAALHEGGTADQSQRGLQTGGHAHPGEYFKTDEPTQVGQWGHTGKGRDAHPRAGGRVGQRHTVGCVVGCLGDHRISPGDLLDGQGLGGPDAVVGDWVGGRDDHGVVPVVTEGVGLDLPDNPNEVVSMAQFPGDILDPDTG